MCKRQGCVNFDPFGSYVTSATYEIVYDVTVWSRAGANHYKRLQNGVIVGAFVHAKYTCWPQWACSAVLKG